MKISLVSLEDYITIIYNGKNYVIANESTNVEKLFKIVSLINKEETYHDLLIPMFEKFLVEDLSEDIEKYRRRHALKNLKKIKCIEIKEGKVCLKNLNFELPEAFTEELTNAKSDEEIKALINFMYNLADNPFPDVRNRFFEYIKDNTLRITPNGLVVMYRKVHLKSDVQDQDFKVFLSSAYLKIKAQKKSPKNYSVYKLNDELGVILTEDIVKPKFQSTNHTVIGNLAELYNTTEELVFTDDRTRSMTIKLHNKIEIPISECDTNSNNTCSRGLHLSNYSWFKDNNFGTIGLMCLVNPSDIVAIPLDNYPKIRTCAYYPVAVIDNKTIDEIEAIEIKVWDLDYFKIDFMAKIENLFNKTSLFIKLQNLEDPEIITMVKASLSESEMMEILNERFLN